jgi:hypothetical protein
MEKRRRLRVIAIKKAHDQNPGVLAGACLGLSCPEGHLLCSNGILNLARSLVLGFGFSSPVTLPAASSMPPFVCSATPLIRSLSILISFIGDFMRTPRRTKGSTAKAFAALLLL